MQGDLEHLVLDLLEWLRPHPRAYRDVMDAWRTSCPRLPVWEVAVDHGFVVRMNEADQPMVAITARGRAHLERHRAANVL